MILLRNILLVVLAGIAGIWVGVLMFAPDAPDTPPPRAPGAAEQAVSRIQPAPVPAGLLAIPVAGVSRAAIRDSWGDPRENGLREHHGTDIMAPGGTLVTAAGPGTVVKLWTSKAGGTTLYERSADGAWIYYYAHLSAYAPGVREGQEVQTGDPIAFVGDTGNAGPGNYHLHFGLTRSAPGQRWWEGTDVDPFPYLAGRPAPG